MCVENRATIPLCRDNNRDNRRKQAFLHTERSHLPGISELMKRELDSNPWCRVSGSCEGFLASRVLPTAGGSGTAVRGKKEVQNEGCARGIVGRNLINLFIKRFSCLCWGCRVPTGNTRRLNEYRLDGGGESESRRERGNRRGRPKDEREQRIGHRYTLS